MRRSNLAGASRLSLPKLRRPADRLPPRANAISLPMLAQGLALLCCLLSSYCGCLAIER